MGEGLNPLLIVCTP